MKKQGKSGPHPASCRAPERLGDPCDELIAPGNHKYCARHHELASLLAKRRDRAQWRAKGDKYWQDSPLRKWNSRAEYMRDWRRRKKNAGLPAKMTDSPNRKPENYSHAFLDGGL